MPIMPPLPAALVDRAKKSRRHEPTASVSGLAQATWPCGKHDLASPLALMIHQATAHVNL
jgi:hypothetical protein